MPDPTTDPIRAACERVAKHIAESLDLSLDAAMGEESRYPGETSVFPEVLAMLESHLRGPLTDRERTALEALDDSPILSKYHGARGFDIERFVEDYEAWKLKARDALALYPTP